MEPLAEHLHHQVKEAYLHHHQGQAEALSTQAVVQDQEAFQPCPAQDHQL